MLDYLFSLSSLIMISLTSLVLLVVKQARHSLVVISVQYFGVFLSILAIWPFNLALIKLLTGWVTVLILFLAMPASQMVAELESPSDTRSRSPSRVIARVLIMMPEQFFRLLAAGMVLLVVISLTPKTSAWIPGVDFEHLIAGLLLMSLGLLSLGLAGRIMQTFIGLFTYLSGFEIIYAGIESSALVAGLMAGVTLALALICSYFLSMQTLEKQL
jgi:hypothetical protein